MARTDTHRPSAIMPEEYDFVAFLYLPDEAPDFIAVNRKYINDHMERTGGRYSQHEHGGSCHICGAAAMYMAVFYHQKTNTYIKTGLDCADKMEFACDDPTAFRKAVKKGLEARAGKAKARAILQTHNAEDAFDLIVNGIPEEVKNSPNSALYNKYLTLAEMVGNLVRYGSFASEKQEAYFLRLWNDIKTFKEKRAERAAEHATSQHLGTVGERLTLELTVKFRTQFDTAFGTSFLTGLVDKDQNLVIHIGQPVFAQIGNGEKVVVKCTVKAHNVRDGVNQTVIARPKIQK